MSITTKGRLLSNWTDSVIIISCQDFLSQCFFVEGRFQLQISIRLTKRCKKRRLTKAHLVVMPFRRSSFSIDLIIGSSERQRPFFKRVSLSFFSSFKTVAFLSTELVVTPFVLVLILEMEEELPREPVAREGGGLLGPTDGVRALKSRLIGGRVVVIDGGCNSVLVTEGARL